MSHNHAEVFKEEAFELLGELEIGLLELEQSPCDKELIGRVFRALHTIKGSGAMFGFDDLAAFAHELETVFDSIRNERICVSMELINLTLQAGDQIRLMLEASNGGTGADGSKTARILAALKELDSSPAATAQCTLAPSPWPDSAEPQSPVTYRIDFRPHLDIFAKGTNPLLLLNELRDLGDCTVIAHTDAVPALSELDPESCYIRWEVMLTTDRGIDAIRDVFIFAEDDCGLQIESMDLTQSVDEAEPDRRLGEILVNRGQLLPDDLTKTLKDQKRIGELLVDAGLVGKKDVEAALAEQAHARELKRKAQHEGPSSIKVPADRLDSLVDLVGELVTVQARLSQVVSSLGHAELLSIAEEVERLTAELRDNTMSIRMLPIGTTFNKFKRLVRDLSLELGKEVVMSTDGAETELDKTVIERLDDPLVHLIRNSIDHGIEPPEVRAAAGKPRQGSVHLMAVHSGANVLVQIKDDGAGLDEHAIRAKAIEKGLIAPDAELSQREVFALIFAPGFSTAGKITNVSGRGVGMDVVKRNIEALRGSIDISSERGVGTTITLKLPLTLAIIDGLLVRIGGTHFVLPLSIVEECVELTREDVARAHGRHLTHLRDRIVPYIRLRDRFQVEGVVPEIEQIVVTEAQDGKIGLVVDEVVGQHQTVIKSLGRFYRNLDGISGATILGDGTLALIMDVPQLIQGVEQEQGMLH